MSERAPVAFAERKDVYQVDRSSLWVLLFWSRARIVWRYRLYAVFGARIGDLFVVMAPGEDELMVQDTREQKEYQAEKGEIDLCSMLRMIVLVLYKRVLKQ